MFSKLFYDGNPVTSKDGNIKASLITPLLKTTTNASKTL